MNREDSEECVNDTWFAAWRYIPPQRPPKLAAFLGKITRGFAIDRLRKKHAAKRVDLHMADITEETENLNAAISRFTTMIAEILQISDDLAPYTDVINTTQTKNGISITLNEVILAENSLFASVNLDTEDKYDGVGISAGENIKINGREYVCDSSSVYLRQNLEENDNQYVVEWIYDDGVPLQKKADIETEIVVHKQIDDIEGETFTFAFSTSKEELQENTVHLRLDQRISLGEGEVSEIFRVDSTKIQPVGQTFRIILKK